MEIFAALAGKIGAVRAKSAERSGAVKSPGAVFSRSFAPKSIESAAFAASALNSMRRALQMARRKKADGS